MALLATIDTSMRRADQSGQGTSPGCLTCGKSNGRKVHAGRDPRGRSAKEEGGREPRAQLREVVVELPGDDGWLHAGEDARPRARGDQRLRAGGQS